MMLTIFMLVVLIIIGYYIYDELSKILAVLNDIKRIQLNTYLDITEEKREDKNEELR